MIVSLYFLPSSLFSFINLDIALSDLCLRLSLFREVQGLLLVSNFLYSDIFISRTLLLDINLEILEFFR